LNFLHESGAGVSESVVSAIQAIALGATLDVTTIVSNDPSNVDAVDATQFVRAVRAVEEGSAAKGCAPHAARDADGDGVRDTFVAVVVGAKVCFEVLPKKNETVRPKPEPQTFRAFLDVVGMPGAVSLERRELAFVVPAAE
jgi:hypothetical protein